MIIHFAVYPSSQDPPTADQVIDQLVPNGIHAIDQVTEAGHYEGRPISLPFTVVDSNIAAVITDNFDQRSNLALGPVYEA